MDRSNGLGSGRLLGFLLHFVALGVLLPQALHWDGIGFLEDARELNQRDWGHLIYAPLVRVAGALLDPLGLSIDLSARLLSAAAGAGVFVLLAARLQRAGLVRPAADALALAVTASPLLWRQGATIEPSTLTLLALLGAVRAAEGYAQARTPGRLAALAALALASVSIHIVSLCALPWILVHARGQAPVPRRQRQVLVLGLLGLAGVLVLLAPRGELPGFAQYCIGFVPIPDSASAALTQVGAHARHVVGVYREGAPLLSLVSVGTVLVLLVRKRGGLVRPAWLLVPQLGTLLIAGKPVAALLLPTFLALADIAAAGAVVILAALPGRAILRYLLPPTVALQVGYALLVAFHSAAAPDPQRQAAEAYAAALPAGAVVAAGPAARHVRWFTDAPVLLLPDHLHGARPGERHPLEVLANLVRREAEHGRRVYLTDEAQAWLTNIWGADPSALLELSGTLVVGPLRLLPFRKLSGV